MSGAAPPLLNHDLHAIDATPARMAWGARYIPARSSQRAPDSLVDLRTGCDSEAARCPRRSGGRARGDGHDPEVDPELGIVAARAACVPTFLVGLSPDAVDPRVLDAEKRKRKVEADWSLALMAQRRPGVSK